MFLESTSKQQTALQIKSWIDSCRNNMQSAKSNFESIKSWLTNSMDNPDYTEEDRSEVISQLTELHNLAITLAE